ncbi:hypothetical protein [Kitasatospora camelliae]|uniref:Secreted protein with PEP-CTERM sorting signal n=1 Tax=Kitasatospora camelliae TaxID=3156397 RepID=A0AAU8JX46_9ACTN
MFLADIAPEPDVAGGPLVIVVVAAVVAAGVAVLAWLARSRRRG